KTLVLLRGVELDRESWRHVIDWVSEGGTLVVAGVRHLPKQLASEPTNDASAVTDLRVAGEYQERYPFDTLRVRAPSGTALRTSVSRSSWILSRFDMARPDGQSEMPYAVEMGIGTGHAIVFAERAPFTNIALTVDDDGAFAATFLDNLGKDVEFCDLWTG